MDATEALLIEYDPNVISYSDLLRQWSKQHNPYVRQRSRQYRSAIWVQNKRQRKQALAHLEQLRHYQHGFGKAPNPRKVHAEVEDVGSFYRAEDYHQEYVQKHGGPGFFM